MRQIPYRLPQYAGYALLLLWVFATALLYYVRLGWAWYEGAL